jgi:choline-sulfatase
VQKHCFYEGAVGVPLIMAGPGLPQGARREHIVSLLDLYPTIAAMCGITPPSGLEGEPLQGVIDGNAPVENRRAFSEFYAFGYAERMIRTPRWKYIHSDNFAPQLYDEVADPQEKVNLADNGAYIGICRELEAALFNGWEKHEFKPDGNKK